MKPIRTLAALLVLFLLISCRAAPDKRTITFSVFGEPAEFAAYQELTAAFETQFPDIHVELRHIPNQKEYRQRLATEFAGGSPSNVVLLNYRRFATFADEGGLEPMGPYLESSELIHEEDFYPVTLQSFQYKDQLWCIPQNLSSLVVYYNRDLFDNAGLDYPADDWTWSDFLHAARVLTQDLDDDGRIDQYGAGISPKLFRLAPFVWQNGGDIVDDPVTPTRLTLDTPAARTAFEWFVNLQTKEHVVPDAAAETAEPSENRFLNGRLGMYFNSRRGTPTYRTITNFSWDIAPLPRNVQPAGILHSDAYCMTAATEDKEAAWTFIEFANSPAGQTIVAQSGRTVPSLISVAESPAFLSPDQPPANARIFLDSTPYIRGVPIMDGWVSVEKIAGEEIKKAFYGDATIDEAIQNAIQSTQPYFDKAISQ